MPLYEYQCENCGATFEVIQKFADAPVETCRSCGGKVRRLLSAPAIQFKGSGWYVTDYARKGRTDGGAPGSASTKNGDAGAASGDAAGSAAGSATGSTAPSGAGAGEKK